MIYFAVDNQHEEEVKELINDSGIIIHSIFDDIYEKMCKDNIEYYISEIVNNDGGFMCDEESENTIIDMEADDRINLIDKATSLMCDNEYLSQIVNECTTDAIEGGLREIFIKIEEN